MAFMSPLLFGSAATATTAATTGLIGAATEFSLATTLGTLGTVLGIAGALGKGNAARAAGDYNAQIAEQNAILARQQSAEEERRFRIDASKRMGAMQAAYSASGVTLEGSPMDVLEESFYTAEMDALTIRQGGRASAAAYKSEAQLSHMQGRAGQQAGYTSAAAELLRGASSYYKMRQT